MRHPSPQFIDLRTASEIFPFCKKKVLQFIHDGRLPAWQVDGKYVIKRVDLERLVTAIPVTPLREKEDHEPSPAP